MPSMDVGIELGLGKEAGGEVILSIDFKITDGGCHAHMGSLNYPGHPAEPMEIEIETIFWPCKKWNAEKKTWDDDHVEFPSNGLPDEVYEAIIAYICEHYNAADYYEEI